MGVDLGRRCVGQSPDRARRHVGEIKVAIDRREHRLAVGRPFIFDNSLRSADAGAFAPHLLGFGDLAATDLGRIDQQPLLARGRVRRPKVKALAVLRARLQQGRIAPVRRQHVQPLGEK